MTGNDIDVVFCFDTTGSMTQAIGEVRKNVREMVQRLFRDIPGIKIGIVAHGDYCDERTSYLMVKQDLTENVESLVNFVNTTGNTQGGDTPEAYEHVLHEVQRMAWTAKAKVLVMIADAYPHTQREDRCGHPWYDWRTEVAELKRMGVSIYSMQCLDHGNGQSYNFFSTMARETEGYHLQLSQFSYVHDVLMGICMQLQGEESLQNYEQEVTKSRGGTMPIMLKAAFDLMLHRTTAPPPMTAEEHTAHFRRSYASDETESDPTDLRPCPPAMFQVIDVDVTSPIADFVRRHGLVFHKGDGYYEWTKKEEIQEYKKVVLMERRTGNLFYGARAREIAGIPMGTRVKNFLPTILADYVAFIQSTSSNRNLIGGTKFLYKVPRESS